MMSRVTFALLVSASVVSSFAPRLSPRLSQGHSRNRWVVRTSVEESVEEDEYEYEYEEEEGADDADRPAPGSIVLDEKLRQRLTRIEAVGEPTSPLELEQQSALKYLVTRLNLEDEVAAKEAEWMNLISVVGDLGMAMDVQAEKDALELELSELVQKEKEVESFLAEYSEVTRVALSSCEPHACAPWRRDARACSPPPPPRARRVQRAAACARDNDDDDEPSSSPLGPLIARRANARACPPPSAPLFSSTTLSPRPRRGWTRSRRRRPWRVRMRRRSTPSSRARAPTLSARRPRPLTRSQSAPHSRRSKRRSPGGSPRPRRRCGSTPRSRRVVVRAAGKHLQRSGQKGVSRCPASGPAITRRRAYFFNFCDATSYYTTAEAGVALAGREPERGWRGGGGV